MGMLDQTTRGHRFLNDTFGLVPRVGWQINPFGGWVGGWLAHVISCGWDILRPSLFSLSTALPAWLSLYLQKTASYRMRLPHESVLVLRLLHESVLVLRLPHESVLVLRLLHEKRSGLTAAE